MVCGWEFLESRSATTASGQLQPIKAPANRRRGQPGCRDGPTKGRYRINLSQSVGAELIALKVEHFTVSTVSSVF